jgi:thiol-disulfide isomerase/thioredoxin
MIPTVRLCVFVLCGALPSASCADADKYPLLKPGDRVPEYEARNLDGGAFSMDQLEGQAVLINVWATWCITCRTEMPLLQKLSTQYSDRGLRVIGINTDTGQDDADVRAFLHDLGITFPTVRDPEDRVTRVLRLRGVPETLLIDGNQRIVNRWIGPITVEQIAPVLDELLATR